MRRRSTVLTREERDVLILATQHPGGRHLSNSEMAQLLGTSVNRVKTLIRRACLKLGAQNRRDAILSALRWGEIRLDEFYSLDELAEVCISLGPAVLRRMAYLMRQQLEHGHLPGQEEQTLPANRRPDGVLTERERDVLSLAWRGLTNAEIADRLCMSPSSVRTFLNRACTKLGARKRADAVVLALKQREISIGEIVSLNEMLQFLEPLGPESVEKIAQLLDQTPGKEPLPTSNQHH